MGEHGTTLSKETIAMNFECLKMFADEIRHQQNTTFTVMVVFITGSAGLLTALEFMVKSLGETTVGLVGLASVVVSFLSCITPRRQWYRSVEKAYSVQTGLLRAGFNFIELPFGSKKPQGGLRTTHIVHLIGLIVWSIYLWRHVEWHQAIEAFGKHF